MAGNLIARSVHDLTAAAWFGGSLMGAIGLNGAASQAKDSTERTRLSALGWKRWAPVQATALVGHVIAGIFVISDNKGRIASQDGMTGVTAFKTAVTLTGAGFTLYTGLLGRKVEQLAGEGAEGATEPGPNASKELEPAQKKLRLLQWALPFFAGTVIILGAKHAEMQRPRNVLKGFVR
ncbi:hypothetical protein IV500_13815 [Paeniglutamicibacter antarcticus]|uniref:Uncharacterized protein n=1 Tax=Arthrobacter terrae TaxID=2935737 RepID=A0A931G8R1_9MICC|nr:hypothetical protein [Arthrobacter terrae]MBG0740459.1 hypothetical protein [Arthrobacter terrae]